jgi:hypothetical protein
VSRHIFCGVFLISSDVTLKQAKVSNANQSFNATGSLITATQYRQFRLHEYFRSLALRNHRTIIGAKKKKTGAIFS